MQRPLLRKRPVVCAASSTYFLVHQPVSRFSLEHSIFLRNRGTPSLWFQQASRTVNLTESYPCVHSRTISLHCTMIRYESSGQYRYEYHLRIFRTVGTQWLFGIIILSTYVL